MPLSESSDISAVPEERRKEANLTNSDEETASSPKSGMSTFEGVIRPALIVMVGVVLFLREGWVVGQAGLLGTTLIVLLSFAIAALTSISLATLSTNTGSRAENLVRVFGQALGFEAAGVLSALHFLAQTFFAAVCVLGFAEAWTYIFPPHPSLLVAFLILIAATATVLVARDRLSTVATVVLALLGGAIASSLVAFAVSAWNGSLYAPILLGAFTGGDFWFLFAILFAGTSGITVGPRQMQDLSDPYTSIRRGTLKAVWIAGATFLLMAIWFGFMASPAALDGSALIAVERAIPGELVLLALFAATFFVAVMTLADAGRILQGLFETSVIPSTRVVAKLVDRNDPRLYLAVSMLVVGLTLPLLSFNSAAVACSLVLLLLFLGINGLVAVENWLGLIAYRPISPAPKWIPLAGAGLCAICGFMVAPALFLAGLVLSLALAVYLGGRPLKANFDLARSGLLPAMAGHLARSVSRRGPDAVRAWQPDFLVPVEHERQLDSTYLFLRALAAPRGTLRILHVIKPTEVQANVRKRTSGMADRDLFSPIPEPVPEEPVVEEVPAERGVDLVQTTAMLNRMGIRSMGSVVEAASLAGGLEMTASVLNGMHDRPNVVLGLAHLYDERHLQAVAEVARRFELGLGYLYFDEEAGFGNQRTINVWVSDRSSDGRVRFLGDKLNLSLLLAHQLARNWTARIKLITVVPDRRQKEEAEDFLRRLARDARLSPDTDYEVRSGRFMEQMAATEPADLHIVGVPRQLDMSFLRAVVRLTGRTCLFVRGNADVDALA